MRVVAGGHTGSMSIAEILLVPGSLMFLAVLLVLASWLENRLVPQPEAKLAPLEVPVTPARRRAA